MLFLPLLKKEALMRPTRSTPRCHARRFPTPTLERKRGTEGATNLANQTSVSHGEPKLNYDPKVLAKSFTVKLGYAKKHKSNGHCENSCYEYELDVDAMLKRNKAGTSDSQKAGHFGECFDMRPALITIKSSALSTAFTHVPVFSEPTSSSS
jgi:hypothetical protein